MLWLCGALHGFTHVYQVALLPLYLFIQKDLGLTSSGQATFLVTVMGLSFSLVSYPVGILADRLSRRMLLGVGLAVNGLAFIGLAYASSYPWAIAWCILAGLGGSCYHPAATAMLVDLFPTGAGKALGRVGMGAAIGFWAGPVYAGWRCDMSGWRAPVLELGLMGIGLAVIFAWLAPDVHSTGARHETGIGSKPPVLTTRFWLVIVLISFFFSLRDFAGAGMGSLMSLFLQRAHKVNVETTGRMLGWMFLVAILSNPLLGAWSDRFRLRLSGLVLVIAGAMVALAPWVSLSWIVLVLMLYGFFFLASHPIAEAALMESVPERVRGRVFGLFVAIAGGISSLSHWAMGHWVNTLPNQQVSSYVPLFNTLTLSMTVALAGLPCLRWIRKYSRS